MHKSSNISSQAEALKEVFNKYYRYDFLKNILLQGVLGRFYGFFELALCDLLPGATLFNAAAGLSGYFQFRLPFHYTGVQLYRI